MTFAPRAIMTESSTVEEANVVAMDLPVPTRSSPGAASVCFALSLIAAPSAHAGMWMLVYAEGSRPARSAYYAAFDDVQSRTSPDEFLAELQRTGDPVKAEAATRISQIRVNQIHESASGPWLTMYTLEFRCGSQQMRMTGRENHYRQNGRVEPVAGHEWQPLSAPWHAQSWLVACDESRWKSALESDRRRGEGQDALNQLGLVVVGDHVLPMGLNDLTFATLWRDGSEPEFTTDKSPAELQRRRDEAIARGNALREDLQETEQGLRRGIASAQAEAAFMADIDRNFAAKSYPLPFQDLVRGMKGWTEQEIIDVWGYPDDERMAGGHRMWVYFTRKDERVANVVSKHGHVEVTGDLRECALMFILQEGGDTPGGRLFDYQMDGSNCTVATMTRRVP